MSRKLRVNAGLFGAFLNPSRRAISRWSIGLLALALVACSDWGNSNFPIFRSFGWFSRLNADDIRDACLTGSPNRYRLVYNAVWGTQVRDYEIVTDPIGGGGQLAVRIIFPEAPSSIDLTDPLKTFSGQRSAVALTPADLQELTASLQSSGFYGPAPSGLVLPSDGYYWVAAACENGAFHFNAWVYPSDRFAAIRFDGWLFRRDATGVAVNPAQPVPPRQQYNRNIAEDRDFSIFDLEVGTNGLANLL
jgi:hypothetical protein